MPNMDDFHAFQSTTGGGSGDSDLGGCLSPYRYYDCCYYRYFIYYWENSRLGI